LEIPERRQELRIVAVHDRPAFVKDRQKIAQGAAAAPFTWDLGRVQGVDARLGAREGEPGEGVEEIVQAVRPRLDAAGLV
jgi:hypothetical protein